MFTDDLPWPELGNVSRGATRGNQGQKGVLGPPDSEGRCVLQLRVQPGVLAVRLNRKSSEWYRILDNEVNNALKLTKTYWRKARRRQDYNARADQDHMELHEWLQQLKDKVMAHIELLMQKGDIQGPPYIMSDHIDFSFMRKFIERHVAGIPHNPRLRNAPDEQHHIIPDDFDDSEASDPRGTSEGNGSAPTSTWRNATENPASDYPGARPSLAPPTDAPTWAKAAYPESASAAVPSEVRTLVQSSESTTHSLRQARERLASTRLTSQEALAKYMTALEAERAAERDVSAAEGQRDDFVSQVLHHISPSTLGRMSSNANISSSSQSPATENGPENTGYSTVWAGAGIRNANGNGNGYASPHANRNGRGASNGSRNGSDYRGARQWSDSGSSATGEMDVGPHTPLESSTRPASAMSTMGTHPDVVRLERIMSPARKHPRDWDHHQRFSRDTSPEQNDPPPRKRVMQIALGADSEPCNADASDSEDVPS